MSLWLDIKIAFTTVFKVFANADNENKGATVVANPADAQGVESENAEALVGQASSDRQENTENNNVEQNV